MDVTDAQGRDPWPGTRPWDGFFRGSAAEVCGWSVEPKPKPKPEPDLCPKETRCVLSPML